LNVVGIYRWLGSYLYFCNGSELKSEFLGRIVG
jgi:hypothetical protein